MISCGNVRYSSRKVYINHFHTVNVSRLFCFFFRFKHAIIHLFMNAFIHLKRSKNNDSERVKVQIKKQPLTHTST